MVSKFENILSDELYNETLDYVKSLMGTNGQQFTTSIFNWDNNLIKSSVPVLRYDFNMVDHDIAKKIKKEIENKIPYFIDRFCLHVWPNLSYITWHPDEHVQAAFTIYLNENWDKDWGGYLMYKDSDTINAIKPEKNLGVLQENGVEHSVTAINIGADLRISLQFFLSRNKKML